MEGGPRTLNVAPAAAGDAVGGGRRTIAYQPALDGVRALAVLAVLLFHGGAPGFDGGYLGVSVFFTLSGYLITSLLVAEMDRDGHVALREFYARRARRLLPASVLVVVVIAVTAALTDWFDAIDELRIQLVGSLLQIANWVFLASEGSYQDLLEDSAGVASPVEHYWSLAIEEQFYWLWPLVFVALWRRGGTRRGRTVALGALTAAAFVTAPVIAIVWGADAAYWSTPARAGEILVGAFVGLVLAGRAVPARAAVLAPIALAVLAAAVVLFPSRGGPAFQGALPLVGVVSAALLVGLQADSGTRRFCSVSPLVWLGTISYGVYLFHWPIFVVMNEERVGVDGPLLFVLRIATTLVVAQLSFTLFEQPIRRGLRLTAKSTLIGAGVATAAAIVLTIALVPGATGSYWEASDEDTRAAAIVVDADVDLTPVELAPSDAEPAEPVRPAGDAASSDAASSGSSTASTAVGSDDAASDDAAPDPGTDPAADRDDDRRGDDSSAAAAADQPAGTTGGAPAAAEPIAEPSRPVRVVVVGDSTASAFGAGLVQWAADRPTFAQVEVHAAPGCGLVRGGEFLLNDVWSDYEPGCEKFFHDHVIGKTAELSPDVVVVMTSSWDVIDRRWPDEAPRDDTTIVAASDRVVADYEAFADRLAETGVPRILWLEMPTSDPQWDPAPEPQEDPQRHAVLHAAMATVAATSDRVSVLDFDGWFTEQGFDVDRDIRPDGIHPTPEASAAIAASYLGDQVLRVALGLD